VPLQSQVDLRRDINPKNYVPQAANNLEPQNIFKIIISFECDLQRTNLVSRDLVRGRIPKLVFWLFERSGTLFANNNTSSFVVGTPSDPAIVRT
jgi:hypothetical protein